MSEVYLVKTCPCLPHRIDARSSCEALSIDNFALSKTAFCNSHILPWLQRSCWLLNPQSGTRTPLLCQFKPGTTYELKQVKNGLAMVYFFLGSLQAKAAIAAPAPWQLPDKAARCNLAQLLHRIHARQQSRFLTKVHFNQPRWKQIVEFLSLRAGGGGIGLDYPGPWHGSKEEFERLITLNPAVSRIGHKASVLTHDPFVAHS